MQTAEDYREAAIIGATARTQVAIQSNRCEAGDRELADLMSLDERADRLDELASEPRWLGAVVDSMFGRWGFAAGWDGYSGVPTRCDLAGRLLDCLGRVMPPNGAPPLITPLADGGLQAEWHRRGMSLELEVSAGHEPSFYYCDASGDEREGSVEAATHDIRDLIGRFL